MTLQIGYAQAVLAPSLGKPLFLAGFGRHRRAETIHDVFYGPAPWLFATLLQPLFPPPGLSGAPTCLLGTVQATVGLVAAKEKQLCNGKI
jgi:hypothetical protein